MPSDNILGAGELNASHIGKRITVNDKQIAAAGTLAGVSHDADLISEKPLGGEESFAVGRIRVVLTFVNGSYVRASSTATVELLDK